MTSIFTYCVFIFTAFMSSSPSVPRTWSGYKRFVEKLVKLERNEQSSSDLHTCINASWYWMCYDLSASRSVESDNDLVQSFEDLCANRIGETPTWFVDSLRRLLLRKQKSVQPSRRVETEVMGFTVCDSTVQLEVKRDRFVFGKDANVSVRVSELPKTFAATFNEDESLLAIVGFNDPWSWGKVSVYDDEGFLWSHRLVSIPLDDPISMSVHMRCSVIIDNELLYIFSASNYGLRIEAFEIGGKRLLLFDSEAFRDLEK